MTDARHRIYSQETLDAVKADRDAEARSKDAHYTARLAAEREVGMIRRVVDGDETVYDEHPSDLCYTISKKLLALRRALDTAKRRGRERDELRAKLGEYGHCACDMPERMLKKRLDETEAENARHRSRLRALGEDDG